LRYRFNLLCNIHRDDPVVGQEEEERTLSGRSRN